METHASLKSSNGTQVPQLRSLFFVPSRDLDNFHVGTRTPTVLHNRTVSNRFTLGQFDFLRHDMELDDDWLELVIALTKENRTQAAHMG